MYYYKLIIAFAFLFYSHVFCMSKDNNMVQLLRKRQEGIPVQLQRFHDGSEGILPVTLLRRQAPSATGDEPQESYRVFDSWVLTYEDKIKRFIDLINLDHSSDTLQGYEYNIYQSVHCLSCCYENDHNYDDFMLTLICNRFYNNKQYALSCVYRSLKLNEQNYTLFKKMVKDYKFNVNYLESDNFCRTKETPLHDAVGLLNAPLVSLLLELNANVSMPDSEGYTPEERLINQIAFLKSKPHYNYPSVAPKAEAILALLTTRKNQETIP